MNISLGLGYLKEEEFLSAFENCSFDPSSFHHADHVRLAWIYVHGVGAIAAEQRLLEGIRKLATHVGAPKKFLYTATIAWVRLVALAIEKDPSDLPFAAWIAEHPELLDKNLLDRFYSTGILKAEPARTQWVEPDRQPMKL